MSRPNTGRTVDYEATIAERVKFEREQRGWSPAQLAQAMTAAGCSIQTQAIYRWEQEDKPRRITANELVTLSKVFEVPIDEMLTPVNDVILGALDKLVAEREQAADEACYQFMLALLSFHVGQLELLRMSGPVSDKYWELADSGLFDPGPREVFPVVTLADGSERPVDPETWDKLWHDLHPIFQQMHQWFEHAAQDVVGWVPAWRGVPNGKHQ